MRVVVADWESYYDSKTYTLSRMTTESYVRDPRFEAHGCAIKWQHDIPARWYDQDEIRHIMAEEDWSDVFMIHHHAQFDSLIESHHYDCHPKMIGCTLAMARLLIGNHLSVSLEAVRKHFGMPGKLTPYNLFDGRHWNELTPDVQQQIADGACDEVESIFKIFGLLLKDFPPEEMEVVDTTIKMFSEPVLRADTRLLADVWEREANDKQRRLAALDVSEAELQSSDRFADLLRQEGVEPETKDGKNRQIYAFAKTDQFMRDLLEDDNERVQTLVEARLGVKSTLMQTRAETLGFMASRGAMPVYLRYCGAHTTRWSGGDGANWQNFKRTDPDNPNETSPLRRAIMAPEGYLLASIDLSQIEVRCLGYCAGQWDEIEKFRNGEDPYVGIASKFYGRVITKADTNERGTGKQAILSCGYQCGPSKFQATARLGIYGPPVHLTLEESERFVHLYREEHGAVTDYWKEAGRMISRLAGGPPLDWGPFHIRDGKLYLPNGAFIDYRTLEFFRDPETGDAYWRIKSRRGWSKLYSGRLVENVIQALARGIMSQAMIRIVRKGYRVVNTTHDELLILIPRDGQETQHAQYCLDEMKREPTWLPGIPLDAEAHLGERYSK